MNEQVKEENNNQSFPKELDYGEWSISKERELSINVFHGRFNYFLIVFSLFVTAGFVNSFEKFKCLVFYSGAILLFLCWRPLYRAMTRVDMLTKSLFGKDGYILYDLQGYEKKFISGWTGIFIPIVCILFLIAIGVLIQSKVIG
jgi:hypothetical protein